jgi:phosphorylcholine metabolism protein LicD
MEKIEDERIEDEKVEPDLRDQGKDWLEKTHLVLKRMIHIFHKICEKHEIPYFAIGGTLLGAYRHKGFIPWDADADMGMMMNDYMKFKEIVEKELPKDIFFQNCETDPYRDKCNIGLVKLRDRYSCYCEHHKQKEHQGIQLDIFLYTWKGKYTLRNLGWPEKVPYKMIFPVKKMIFEDIEICVPNKTKEFLNVEYPASLDLPPIHLRYPHEGRVNPYIACCHPASLNWYNGTFAFMITLNQLDFIDILNVLLCLATSCRKKIVLYCDEPKEIKETKEAKEIILKIVENKMGLFPPIKHIKTMEEWISCGVHNFENRVYNCKIGITNELMNPGNSKLEIINICPPNKTDPITNYFNSLYPVTNSY